MMKARVKKIENGTFKETEDRSDIFCMPEKIGKIIEVEPRENARDWFVGLDDDLRYNYHSSWLKFLPA